MLQNLLSTFQEATETNLPLGSTNHKNHRAQLQSPQSMFIGVKQLNHVNMFRQTFICSVLVIS